MRLSSAFLLASAACASASNLVKRDALPAFPPGNQVYIGAWISGAQGFSDTPSAYNNRTGLSMPVFQYSQRLPLHPYDYVLGQGWDAFFYLATWTSTNTNFFLTVYADEGLGIVTDGDLVALATQIARYQSEGRTVYLRFLPEMQGNWNLYGLQPAAYVAMWQRMYTIIKQIAPTTVVVWAPNFSYGYPYGVSLSSVNSSADRTALDTNNNGQLDAGDDAYAPYYPGDAWVDACGLSVYYKGPDHANVNQGQPAGTCAQFLNGHDPWTGQQTTPFYETYCQAKNKECIITEIGAAYHVDKPGGASRLDVQEAFMNDCIFNTTFLDAFPLIKLINIFEQQKNEEDPTGFDMRDYRLTNDTTVLAAFQSGVSAMGTRFAFATPSTVSGLGTVTQTAIPTDNPRLVTTQLMTTTVPSFTEQVVWTYTSYSSPTPTAPAGGAAAPSTVITGSVTTQAIVSNALKQAVQSSAAPSQFTFSATLVIASLFLGCATRAFA